MPLEVSDARALIRALVDAGVEFIVIGGVGAQLLGSPVVTLDLDVCYSRDRANLDRLARVLVEMDARLRGAPSGLPFRLDAQTLWNGDSFTFVTSLGAFDILATPSGTSGFEDLARSAVTIEVDARPVRVASIDDLIRMKRAAGRTKDLIALEHLGALRDELDRLP
jgi:hypothetical protein